MGSDQQREQIRRRLAYDLHLDESTIDGVLEILEEETAVLDHTLDDWACDNCGKRKATATRGVDGPALCNHCLFEKDEDEIDV